MICFGSHISPARQPATHASHGMAGGRYRVVTAPGSPRRSVLYDAFRSREHHGNTGNARNRHGPLPGLSSSWATTPTEMPAALGADETSTRAPNRFARQPRRPGYSHGLARSAEASHECRTTTQFHRPAPTTCELSVDACRATGGHWVSRLGFVQSGAAGHPLRPTSRATYLAADHSLSLAPGARTASRRRSRARRVRLRNRGNGHRTACTTGD